VSIFTAREKRISGRSVEPTSVSPEVGENAVRRNGTRAVSVRPRVSVAVLPPASVAVMVSVCEPMSRLPRISAVSYAPVAASKVIDVAGPLPKL